MEQLATDAIKQIYLQMEQSGNKLPLPESDICSIFEYTEKHLLNQPSILTLNGDFTIVGDLHGSISSLLRIFTENGAPDTRSYIFLGDYIDRGSNSIEVLLMLFSFKILYPENVYLIRGNHEFPSMTASYGFRDECFSRHASRAYYYALSAFDELPLGAILNDNIFCVHGGISSQITDHQSLYAIQKPKIYHDSRSTSSEKMSRNSINSDVSEILENIPRNVLDLLWSDPSNTVHGYAPSPRGCGCLFGNDSLTKFLSNINCALVVRSHESCPSGYKYTFQERRILTIFSAVDYCGLSNYGAYLVFNENGAQLKQLISLQRQKRRWIIPEAVLDLIAQMTPAIDV